MRREAGSKGAKDRSCGQVTKGPREHGKWVQLALCTEKPPESFLQKERGVI